MVTRDAHSLDIEKWAETADAANVAPPASAGLTQSVGYTTSYKTPGGDAPEMEVIQWLWRAWSAMLVELNVHGLLVWNATLSYVHPAMVFGSDGNPYVSVRDNTAVDPTTDANDDDWTLLVVAGSSTFDGSAIVSGVVGLSFLPTFPLNKVSGAAGLASPLFTGNPRAPTPSNGDNDTSIATTAFVQGAVTAVMGMVASLASPNFTGNPRAPTVAASDDDTSIATSAFTQNAIDRRQLVVTADPTQANIDAIPNGGVILVRSTTAYTP